MIAVGVEHRLPVIKGLRPDAELPDPPPAFAGRDNDVRPANVDIGLILRQRVDGAAVDLLNERLNGHVRRDAFAAAIAYGYMAQDHGLARRLGGRLQPAASLREQAEKIGIFRGHAGDGRLVLGARGHSGYLFGHMTLLVITTAQPATCTGQGTTGGLGEWKHVRIMVRLTLATATFSRQGIELAASR